LDKWGSSVPCEGPYPKTEQSSVAILYQWRMKWHDSETIAGYMYVLMTVVPFISTGFAPRPLLNNSYGISCVSIPPTPPQPHSRMRRSHGSMSHRFVVQPRQRSTFNGTQACNFVFPERSLVLKQMNGNPSAKQTKTTVHSQDSKSSKLLTDGQTVR
jgi:hypothetical protein